MREELNVRKVVGLILAVTAALCLTTAAFADAIVGPALILWGIARLAPYLLVAAVVVITIILLRKFRKRK